MRLVCLQYQDAARTVQHYMQDYDTKAGHFVPASMYDAYMAPSELLMYAWLPEVFMTVAEVQYISLFDL